MNEKISYTMTPDTATVIVDGQPTTVKRGARNFDVLRQALLAGDWAKARANLSPGRALERWATGRFSVDQGGRRILWDGGPIPSELNERMLQMAEQDEDPAPLFKFHVLLQQNPSHRSVEQLWRFLNNLGIPLSPDGCLLAYKGVKEDFTDVYSGKICNRPGVVVRFPRNKVSDDPNHACHEGLHVGALEYARNHGPRVVIAKVNPANVVCVPHDSSSMKMRVCEYEIVGKHGEGPMQSTTIPRSDIPQPAKTGGKRSKAHQKLDAMPEAELMDVPMDKLRNYACKALHIVGASRLSGGKHGLVKRILKERA